MPVKVDSRSTNYSSPANALRPPYIVAGTAWRKYVDAFKWQPGAVGYHIASSECSTLKAAGSQVWCKMMLEKGVAATLGPVGEPYLQAFPPPEVFFRFID